MDEPFVIPQVPEVTCPRCGTTDNSPNSDICYSCCAFLPRNTAAMTHGARRSLERPEVLAHIESKRTELTAHLGGDPTVVQADLVTDYARVDVLIESVVAHIEVKGIFTPGGNVRKAASLLLTLLDRRLRLATTLGIERKAKPVTALAEILNGK